MTPQEMGQEIEKYDYDYFLALALDQVPEGMDKREGSIIYDALAPSSYVLASFMMELKNVLQNSFIQTAEGYYLDLKAEEHGIKRIEASPAYGKLKITPQEGSTVRMTGNERFATIGEDPVYFHVMNRLDQPDTYLVKAEVAGTAGNVYVGEVLPVDHINNLSSAYLNEITIPARDEETDDALRERIMNTYQLNDFGGNIEDYIRYTMSIEGVGAVQVYAIWNGGGTVRVVILDNKFQIPSKLLLEKVQTAIDPKQDQEGIGIAPIGHNVTVAAPTKRTIDVTLHVDLVIGYAMESIKSLITRTLESFFSKLRSQWDKHNENYQYMQTVYRSQIISALLQLDGVANVADVKLNGKDQDLALTFTKTTQEVAYLGQVIYT
ncbi:MAG: baseplate J/gp47 family protein [Aerococcus sp.]|nr:baseplate J/gp47 family protein [Aerococcus sp.]